MSLLAAATLTLAAEQVKTYNNSDFGFSLNYPNGLKPKEIKWVKDVTGVELKKGREVITIQAMPAGTDYAKMPFDEYVKIAASAEIANFYKLITIESFVSDYGIEGYKTLWQVVEHADTDSGEVNTMTIAGPIFYFPPRNARQLGGQPVKTIMLSFYSPAGRSEALVSETETIAASFRYLDSFKTMFKRGDKGQLYFVKKGEAFRVELPANPTTGYNWFITDLDEQYFKVSSSGYHPPDLMIPGAGGMSYWNITPKKQGLATIRLLYYRVWEGKENAVDEFTLRAVIF